MANASRVAEIFQQASVAFGRLAHLTLDLKLAQTQPIEPMAKPNVKWTDEEITQLKDAIQRFGSDLSKIAERIETKTLSQIKMKVKSNTLQDAGFNDESSVTSDKPSVSVETATPLPSAKRKQPSDEVSHEDAPIVKRITQNTEHTLISSKPVKSEADVQLTTDVALRPEWSASLRENNNVFVRNTNRPVSADVKIPSVVEPMTFSKSGTLGNSKGTIISEEPGDTRYEDFEDSSEGREDDGDSFNSEEGSEPEEEVGEEEEDDLDDEEEEEGLQKDDPPFEIND